MRILIQAMRAVFVELLGVIIVLWLLFGSVTWTLESTGVQRKPGMAPNLLATLKNSVAAHLETGRAPRQTEDVAARLDYYSRLYRRAATGYLRQVTENLSNDVSHGQRAQQHGHSHTL